jgi:hypothetical protein
MRSVSIGPSATYETGHSYFAQTGHSHIAATAVHQVACNSIAGMIILVGLTVLA